MTQPSRNVTIDIARGFGMLLVVLGHSRLALDAPETFRLIYTFHIPLFFFLAGIFLPEPDGVTIRAFAAAKSSALLKPYGVTLLILGIPLMLLGMVQLTTYLAGAAYATGSSLKLVSGAPLVPLWFLPQLWLATLVCFLLLQRVRSTPARILLVGVLLLIAPNIAQQETFFPAFETWLNTARPFALKGLPWSIDLIPFSVGYMLAGKLLSTPAQTIQRPLLWFVLSLAAFALLQGYYPEILNANERQFGNRYLCVLQAALGITMVLSLSGIVTQMPGKVMASIGRASLFILLFHGAVIYTLEHALDRYAASFQIVMIVTVVVGIAIPLALYHLANRWEWLGVLFLPAKRRT